MCSKPIFCSKIALKGKTCSRLLKLQKVAPNAKSCSKNAEHNRDRPTVDPFDDLCLTNQIYSALLNSKKSLKCKMLTFKCFYKMTKRDLVVASTRHHHARLLKYYPGRQCAPSLIKSRFFSHTTNLLTVLTFLHFEIPYMYTRGES